MPTPPEDYIMLPLSKGQFCKISQEDYEVLSKHKWSAAWNKNTSSYYATRNHVYMGKKVHVRMHRFLLLGMEMGRDRLVDHMNRDTLDNRRCNLRICTPGQNMANSRIHSNNSSGFKGVCFYKSRGEWVARIKIDNKYIFLGSYTCPQKAHAAYCEAAVRLRGEFARFE